MTNPNHEPEDRELETINCPCGSKCCSDKVTSPKGLVVMIVFDCQAFTDEDLNEELDQLRAVINGAFEEDDDDEAETP